MNKLSRSLYRDKEGKEINSERLEELLRDDDYRSVVQETVGPYFISTVWMGVPHGFREPFDYFETMVFLTPPNIKDARSFLGKEMECERYHCFEEALIGHYEVVNKWKDIVPFKEDLE